MKFLLKHFWLIFFIITVVIFALPFWAFGKLPIPSDAMVGLYHPFRDNTHNEYPNGIPFKNPLITDVILQQYPYRFLAISELKQGHIPKWNPFAFSGTPLLANIQSAVFYPLNILFVFINFEYAWSVLVILQPLLTGVFCYWYLKNLDLNDKACFAGAVSFAFSGFMTAWFTWNTLGHVALWMPLILLAKDKLITKFSWAWVVTLVAAEVSMIFAGHIQTVMYVILFTTVYLFFRTAQKYKFGTRIFWRKLFLFLITGSVVLFVASIQLIPTLQFILSSAREFDLPDWHRVDWFIPLKQLVQFVAPDFFGNPVTNNYWGVWNYGEFSGYVGIISLILAFVAVIFRRSALVLFFSCSLLLSLLMALPTPLGKLPYILNLPFISSLQPSRILVLIDFLLAVLAAIGLDYVFKSKQLSDQKIYIKPIVLVSIIFLVLLFFVWLSILFTPQFWDSSQEIIGHINITKRNMVLPSIFVGVSFIWGILYKSSQSKRLSQILEIIFILVITADIFRFTGKYIPFTDKSWLYPQTKTIQFLQQNLGSYRFMPLDRRIMPPNTATYYHLQSIEGYDPLYYQKYGQLVASWTRNKPDITPASFNRILTPQNYSHFFADLLGVKYVLSLKDEMDPKLKVVFQEGETRVYENINVFPRAFFVESLQFVDAKDLMATMYTNVTRLSKIAYHSNLNFQEDQVSQEPLSLDESATIINYLPNSVTVKSNTRGRRLLLLSDIFTPEWQVFIDGQKVSLYEVDFCLRAVLVPMGVHEVVFKI